MSLEFGDPILGIVVNVIAFFVVFFLSIFYHKPRLPKRVKRPFVQGMK